MALFRCIFHLSPIALSVAICFGVPSSHAAPTLPQVFDEVFESAYVEGECRQNISRLVLRAHESGVDLRGAEVWMIMNYGRAIDQGLTARMARNPGDPSRVRTERIGDYHVVLVDEGLVYDFDFTNEAEPIEEADYWLQMYLTDQERANGYVRLSIIGDFYLTAYTALSYVEYLKGKRTGLEHLREERLKERLPELFSEF